MLKPLRPPIGGSGSHARANAVHGPMASTTASAAIRSPSTSTPATAPRAPLAASRPLHRTDADPRPAAPAGGIDERAGERAGLDLRRRLRGADAPVDRAVAVEPRGSGLARIRRDRALVGPRHHQGVDPAVAISAAVVGVEPLREIRVQVEARAGERTHRVAVAPVTGEEAARLPRSGGRDLAPFHQGHLDPELGQVPGGRGSDDPTSADDDMHEAPSPSCPSHACLARLRLRPARPVRRWYAASASAGSRFRSARGPGGG